MSLILPMIHPPLIEAAGGFDPEAGLTLTSTFADLATITSGDVDRANPVVFAIGLDFSSTPTGVIFEHGGGGIGAYVGVQTTPFGDGELEFRFGDGANPVPVAGTTSFVVASGNVPTGQGTLVWEFDFTASAGGDLRAWWEGVLMTGTLDAQNNKTTWSGTDDGSVLQQGGSQIAQSSTASAWTGGASLDLGRGTGLRYYANQTVTAPA